MVGLRISETFCRSVASSLLHRSLKHLVERQGSLMKAKTVEEDYQELNIYA